MTSGSIEAYDPKTEQMTAEMPLSSDNSHLSLVIGSFVMASKILDTLARPMPAGNDCLPHAAMNLASVRIGNMAHAGW